MSRPLTACLRCGSTDLRPLTLADGLAAEGGELLKWVCNACDWQGTPLEFEAEEDLAAFREGLTKDEA